MKWQKLPGTAKEALAISRQFDAAQVFRGDKATEQAIKRVSAPRVLHLATHGFFLPDAAPAVDAVSSALVAGGAPPTDLGPENPLLRSGLVFAGANQLSSGDEDGVLTALEASGLDLWGTQLVVLSACETAVGKVSPGEGGYGLRRALTIAGAESMVMSLWQVDAAATRDLMSGYYRRLKTGKGRTEALRLMQLRLLRSDDYRPPYYWAAFIPSGQWGPITR